MTCDKRSFARKIVNIHQFSYQCREHRRKSHRERRREDISPLAFRGNFCSFTTALAAKFPALLHSHGAGGDISGHVPAFPWCFFIPTALAAIFPAMFLLFPGDFTFQRHWRRYFRHSYIPTALAAIFPALLHSDGAGGDISGHVPALIRRFLSFGHSVRLFVEASELLLVLLTFFLNSFDALVLTHDLPVQIVRHIIHFVKNVVDQG